MRGALPGRQTEQLLAVDRDRARGHLVVAAPHEHVRQRRLARAVRAHEREMHALMGPNGSGKSTLSHVLMGRNDYEVTAGPSRSTARSCSGARPGSARARPVPGDAVPGRGAGREGGRPRGRGSAARGGEAGDLDTRLHREAERLSMADEFLARGVNDEFSGGEQKRMETLQLAVLEPKFAILDEIDSGLDVDALRDVARRIEAMTTEQNVGVLAITHYARLLTELRPTACWGRVVRSGGAGARPTARDGLRGDRAELGIDEHRGQAPSGRSVRRTRVLASCAAPRARRPARRSGARTPRRAGRRRPR